MVYSISAVLLIRCLHVIILVIYLVIVPCFMCSDNCCLKRALVNEKPAPREVIRQLKHHWTWKHDSQKFASQNCMLCLGKFEQDQRITYVPCQLCKLRSDPHSMSSARISQYSACSGESSFDNSHVLHFDCLKSWLLTSSLCPVCSKTLSMKKLSQDKLNELILSQDPYLMMIKGMLKPQTSQLSPSQDLLMN